MLAAPIFTTSPIFWKFITCVCFWLNNFKEVKNWDGIFIGLSWIIFLKVSEYDSDEVWDRGRGFWIYMNAADTLTGTP